MKRSTTLAMSVSCFAVVARAQQPAAVEPQSQPAGLAWFDYDVDGKLDALAILPTGQAVLLRNRGDGGFEDASAVTGLAKLPPASFAIWHDVDSDGLADLYVGADGAGPRLWRNAGGTFEPCDCGIDHVELDLDARWLDIDDDGLADLVAATELGELVYRNLGGARFERIDLPLPASEAAVGADDAAIDGTLDPVQQRREQFRARLRQRMNSNAPSSATAPSTTPGVATPALPSGGGPALPLIACRPGIMDIATMGCVDVSSTPTLGMLYPLSANLSVNSVGNVGVGTASPATNPLIKLSIAGSANVDFGSLNSGTADNALHFGGQTSAEAIGSKKTAGGNQNGLDFYTFGVNRMAITNGGNIGIGTTAPSVKLDVAGTVKVDAGNTNSGTTSNALHFGGGNTGEVIGSKRTAGGNQFGLDFYTGSANRVAITSAGNVGVNTTTPEGRVHVLDGNAGTVTADGNSGIVVEDSTRSYISILTPDGDERGILFGEPSNNSAGGVVYNNASTLDGLQFRTNGNVTRMVVSSIGNVGIGTTAPSASLHVAGNDGLLAGGTFGSGAVPPSGAGTRMLWYPRKAALRAGNVTGTEWDDASIGIYSAALGLDSVASGPGSTAAGADATASGSVSTAIGNIVTASGNWSVALGDRTTASGNDSTGLGYLTTASGEASTAMGRETLAQSYVVTALGRWNVGGGNPLAWSPLDPLFEIGNGTSSVARANAMTVRKNGSVGVGTTSPDSLLHVHTSSAGTVTANSSSVITGERNGDGYISLLTPDANERGILFGEPSNSAAGGVFYNSPAVQDGLEFRTNGNQSRMSISGAGNVGIGTSSPGAHLHVASSQQTPAKITSSHTGGTWLSLENTSTSGDEWHLISTGSTNSEGAGKLLLRDNTTGVVAATFDTNGNVGIGTTSPSDKLEVVGGIKVDAFDQNTGTTANALRFGGGGSGEAIFSKRSAGGNQYGLDLMTGSASRVSVTVGGNVGIGTTAPTALLDVNGSAAKPGGGSWAVSSDARLKHNVHTLDHALDTLLALRGVTFEYNDPAAIHELPGERIGFIAQEVEQVVPDWVEDGANGYKRMTIRGFEALAVEGMRELADQNTQLKRENEELRDRVSQLEALASDVAALKAELAKLVSVK